PATNGLASETHQARPNNRQPTTAIKLNPIDRSISHSGCGAVGSSGMASPSLHAAGMMVSGAAVTRQSRRNSTPVVEIVGGVHCCQSSVEPAGRDHCTTTCVELGNALTDRRVALAS